MNQNVQTTLLQLCDQVIADPEMLPDVPAEAYPEGSDEWRVLSKFRSLLNRLQESKQEAINRKQVQVEEQLREKEAQYRSIFEATTDALIVNDPQGFVVEANSAACEMLGYTHEELIGINYTAFIPPDLQSFVARYLKKILKGNRLNTHTIGIRKDGTSFHADTHGTPFTYLGKPHILSAVRDISEHIHVEEQLREKEEQYRSIFEATTDGILIYNWQGTIVEANPAACQMMGYQYQELIGLSGMAIPHPDSLAHQLKFMQSIQAGNRGRVSGVSLRKDGTPFYNEAYGGPFMYKGEPHLLVVGRDITEQVEAETKLREKEEQYRAIFEASTDALFIQDIEDGRVVEVNPAACKMHGFTYEEFIGLLPNAFIHPDSANLVGETLQTLQNGGQFHALGLAMRKDGTPFHADAYVTMFTYKSKPRILSIVRDVTERFQAEEQIREAYQLLEQRVEERTRELSTLLEISHNVVSTIELRPLVGLFLQKLQEIVNYGGAGLATLEDNEFTFLDYQGPLPAEQILQMRLLFAHSAAHQQVLHSGEPLIISDVYENAPLAQSLRQASRKYLGDVAADYMHSWMGIPLKSKERIVGLLSLSHPRSNFYTPQHARMALAIANQAAVAIENARLYEQAQDLATIQERQRLARELHDSVSQALYGISLGTHTARALLDRDPGKAAEPLDYVLSLTEAALVEMRALIFELRPESLASEGLVSALTKQAAAMQARHGIATSTTFCAEPDLPLKVKKELHRVAQEALHNTIKHAQANKVELRLMHDTEGILLEIRDNGIGFVITDSFPGHLGLHSMRERITHLGGILHIESAPAQGTLISAWIPAAGIAGIRTSTLR